MTVCFEEGIIVVGQKDFGGLSGRVEIGIGLVYGQDFGEWRGHSRLNYDVSKIIETEQCVIFSRWFGHGFFCCCFLFVCFFGQGERYRDLVLQGDATKT